MPKARKSAQRSDVRISQIGSSKAGAQRVLRALKKRDKESRREMAAINRELDTIASDYRKKVSRLIGRAGVLELQRLRNSRAKTTRSHTKRRELAILKEHGIHLGQILELRRPYLRRVYDLLSPGDKFPPSRSPHEGCDSPSVRYAAPYGGYYWTFNWDYSSNARVPIVVPYVDLAAGALGSSVRTSVGRPDDDDRVYAEILTAFNMWHTPQATGPLEISVSLNFPQEASHFSGKATDEWGVSDCMHVQFANVLVRATDSQDPNQTDFALMLTESFPAWNDGYEEEWDHKFPLGHEIRTYRLRTTTTFLQGSPVLIEAGVQHVTRFRTDDVSITTNASVNVLLDQVEVRSCAAQPIPHKRKRRRVG